MWRAESTASAGCLSQTDDNSRDYVVGAGGGEGGSLTPGTSR